MTDRPEVTLLLRFADCVPIVLYDPRRKAVGLVHAGWKGTLLKAPAQAVRAYERVRAAGFFDIGEVRRDSYSFRRDDLRGDVGAGVRLNLPVGPLRLDYGHPVITDHRSGRSGRIQFSVGYQF